MTFIVGPNPFESLAALPDATAAVGETRDDTAA